MNHIFESISNLGIPEANKIIHKRSGIVEYFISEAEKEDFIRKHIHNDFFVCEEKVEYGDWQTPQDLADKICQNHLEKYGSPDIVIEPTCGLGAFVLSALRLFPDISEIHAVEINDRYIHELKYKILINALSCPDTKHPDIYLYNADFFKFDFSSIFSKIKKHNWNLALIGNPPWVTNSKQGCLNSSNIPLKSNIQRLRGIEAITGKSNFDISEYIALVLLKLSQKCRGGVSLLLKNSVIRNIVTKQKTNNLSINNIEQINIDAFKEFHVSVEAACFSARFNSSPAYECRISNFYTGAELSEYGWYEDVFVSNILSYKKYSKYCGNSSFEWRSGIKHDCSSVLEIIEHDNKLINGIGEVVNIETDLLYPLLKSSDIYKYDTNTVIKKYVLIPQLRVGQDTSELKHTQPLTYSYLLSHLDFFKKRKSSIYKDKDMFSVFGVGDYTFKPYKVVISSLYKNLCFVLLSQYNNKPIIVDDTCYQLDFDTYEEAKTCLLALQSHEITSLLKSLVFLDAKRVVTKSLLMKIELINYFKIHGIKINDKFKNNRCCKQLSLFDTL